jgi:hypothetical protein
VSQSYFVVVSVQKREETNLSLFSFEKENFVCHLVFSIWFLVISWSNEKNNHFPAAQVFLSKLEPFIIMAFAYPK